MIYELNWIELNWIESSAYTSAQVNYNIEFLLAGKIFCP